MNSYNGNSVKFVCIVTSESNPDNGYVAHVYYCKDDSEYIVLLYKNGKELKAATYFTDDKSDAIGTAKHMIE